MNIILDIGNVICYWRPQLIIASIFAKPAQQEEALQVTIGHADWLELDRGSLALEQAIERAYGRTSLPAEKIEQVYRRTPMMLKPVDTMVETIERLSARGVPLYVLSNMHKHSWAYLSATYDFWRCFDGVLVSYAELLIKPDPAIYQRICERFALDPSDSVFFDDTLENVVAAREFGMGAVHVTDIEQGHQQVLSTIEL